MLEIYKINFLSYLHVRNLVIASLVIVQGVDCILFFWRGYVYACIGECGEIWNNDRFFIFW